MGGPVRRRCGEAAFGHLHQETALRLGSNQAPGRVRLDTAELYRPDHGRRRRVRHARQRGSRRAGYFRVLYALCAPDDSVLRERRPASGRVRRRGYDERGGSRPGIRSLYARLRQLRPVVYRRVSGAGIERSGPDAYHHGSGAEEDHFGPASGREQRSGSVCVP